eukprot:6296253-Amphidinium_carterae.2
MRSLDSLSKASMKRGLYAWPSENWECQRMVWYKDPSSNQGSSLGWLMTHSGVERVVVRSLYNWYTTWSQLQVTWVNQVESSTSLCRIMKRFGPEAGVVGLDALPRMIMSRSAYPMACISVSLSSWVCSRGGVHLMINATHACSY